jgi:dTDP-glucose 4,6-dehydratase
MNLFITGGAGFIGSNFIHIALKRGHRVLNFDALTYAGNPANLNDIPHPEHYAFVEGSITDTTAIERALAQGAFDVCINFAAESHVDRSIEAARIFTETNVLGTVVLLEAMRTAGVPMFIQISTDEVYGSVTGKDRFSRESPIKPSSPYSASKAAADHLALSFYYTHGYDVRVTRCTNNYGPFQYPEKFIPTIITRALAGEQIPVYGDGGQIRDWIFVDDHCEGIFSVIEHGKPGCVYLFGGSSEVRNIDLATGVLRSIARHQSLPEDSLLPSIEHVRDRPGHDRRYAIDWSTSAKELGWNPRTNFSEGLERTIEWYLHNEAWLSELKTRDR